MSLILKALQASLSNHTLIGIHSDRGDSGKFAVGWITALSDDYYCLESVDEFASPEGVSIKHLDNIWFVEQGSPYIEQIQSVADSSLAFASRSAYRIADMGEALRDLYDRKQVVSLVLEDHTVRTGPILELTDKEIKIQSHDTVGIYEGDKIFRISDLHRIEFAGKAESVLASILQHREGSA